ncbi:MAG: DUF4917 family protein [Deltaproteobacteria bacterium]|nr:DUF4917 family protein [Deltaproteobacteria bacterium]
MAKGINTTGVRLLDYKEVLSSLPEKKKRHLLLGNGFSRALRNDIFSYDALFDQADFTSIDPRIKDLFGSLGTTDFETVMRVLRDASNLINVYLPKDKLLANTLIEHSNALKGLLAKTISDNHPAHPNEIKEEQYQHCRIFLNSFKDVYTLNYDLLLYWTLMHEELGDSLSNDDGFRTPDSGEQEYVTWEVENSNKQTVFYLHGALHLFDAGAELQKYTWKNTQVRLIKQIQNALEEDRYPLIVAEGTADGKRRQIKHSGYLTRGFRSLSNIGETMIMFGVSCSKQDEHILKAIEKGSGNGITDIYVSIFGDPDSDANKRIIRRAKQMGIARPKYRKALTVSFFDASTAKVWG